MRISQRIPTVLAGTLAMLVFSAVPALAAPEKPITEPATEVTATTANLHGELNPKSKASVAYDFTAYDQGSVCEPGESTEFVGEMEVEALKVSAIVRNLAPNTEYHFCLQAFHGESSENETKGVSLPFKTLSAKPVLEGSTRTSGVTPFKATLEAELRASNEKTTYSFNYSTSKALVEEGKGNAIAGTPITGNALEVARVETGATLTPGTTYYYRITAKNGTGTTEGPVESFTTPPVKAPEILSETATNLTTSEPRIEAKVNPEYEETSYEFEYSTSKALVETGKGNVIAGAPPAPRLPAIFEESGLRVGPVAVPGVQAGPVYYYRVVAMNGTGTSDGPVQEFITQAAPLVGAGGSSEVTPTTARVTGTVTPQGQASAYHFVYIDQQGYETGLRATPTEPYTLAKRAATTSLTATNGEALTDYTPHAVEVQLGELTPGTTYHYALIGENEIGRTVSGDQTFTTAPPEPPPPPAGEQQPPAAPNIAALLAPARVIPFAPYTSIAELNAREAKEGKATIPKSLTRAEKLVSALKACHAKHAKQRRRCEATARKHYRPKKTTRKK